MSKIIKSYSIQELTEDSEIILRTQEGVEIKIQTHPGGTIISSYIGNEFWLSGRNVIIKPVKIKKK